MTAPADKVEVVDPLTVKLSLKSPSATMLNNLTGATGGTGSSGALLVSKTAVEKMGEDPFGIKPLGTGPFMVADWKKDDCLDWRPVSATTALVRVPISLR